MPCTRVSLTAFGGPETLELETVPDLPEPAAAKVRIRVLATSAAFTDVMIRKGMYPDVKDKPPFTPGYDMVGVIDATGPGAARFKLEPSLPDLWKTNQRPEPDFPRFANAPEGGITAWYTMRLTGIGADKETPLVGVLGQAIRNYEARDQARTQICLRHFASDGVKKT